MPFLHACRYALRVACLILAGMDLEFRPETLPAVLDDATLDRDRGAFRALLLGELRALDEMIDGELESGKDRVRWAELKLRAVREMAALLKLSGSTPAEEVEVDAGVEQARVRSLVAMQLDELAGREG